MAEAGRRAQGRREVCGGACSAGFWPKIIDEKTQQKTKRIEPFVKPDSSVGISLAGIRLRRTPSASAFDARTLSSA